MADIYEQHRAAFANVSAFVILDGAERVATVAIKFPKDGAGRLYAYVHWLGIEMARGWASGGGYDKRTAAVSAASRGIKIPAAWPHHPRMRAFLAALAPDGGTEWHNALRDAGFTVLQAV